MHTQENESLPGSEPFATGLLADLAARRAQRGEGYAPRTRHLRSDGWARWTNRLFLEASPYLLQHAHNPVNWYPWGPAAFAAARRLQRPILLSVGYATCHWCHVMEEESFEDPEIAAYLNAHFVAVKVDREERPDIDAVYMSAVQALSGRGGWPLTACLTPDGKPFFGGTYFPARDGDRGTPVGFLTLLQKIRRTYEEQGAAVAAAGRQLTAAVRQMLAAPRGERLPTGAVLEAAVEACRRDFDPQNGGRRGAPKFPSSLPVRLLLRHHQRTGAADSLQMAHLTLRKMAAGGLYDHVGGGFHRYATDERWQVPHFEKMLYDNALLVTAYLEGYQVTGDEDLARVARETLTYVARDLTSPDGAFYSATDADSLTPQGQREEGYFFTWTPAEIERAVGQPASAVVQAYYAVGEVPAFEGRHILCTPRPLAEVAAARGGSTAEAAATVAAARERLLAARDRRPAPLRDEKILTAWNGLMISAFARAGLVLDEAGYVDRAAAAARFLLRNLYSEDRLRRSFSEGAARHDAFLEDYAFLSAALLDLYEATGDPSWLEKAVALDAVLEQKYEDARGGFFMTATDQEALIAREMPNYDGAVPSGNAIALMNLLRLSALTARDGYRQRAERALTVFSGPLAANPSGLFEMLLAVDFFLEGPREIVIVAPSGKPDAAREFLARLRRRFLPNRVLTVAQEGDGLAEHTRLVPLLAGKRASGERARAYVCEGRRCLAPSDSPEAFERCLSSGNDERP